MKKKILFTMMLSIVLIGSYRDETRAANNHEATPELLSPDASDAPTILVPLQDATVIAGTDFSIKIKFKSSTAPKVRILKDGTEIKDGGAEGRYVIRTLANPGEIRFQILRTEISDSGVYSIEIEDKFGSTTSSFKLTVKEK